MGFITKLKAWVAVTRPPLTLLGFIAAMGVLRLANARADLQFALITLTIGLGNMGFCILNEVVDADLDARIKPWKPIPSGRVDRGSAMKLSLSTLSLSFLLLLALCSLRGGGLWLIFALMCYAFGAAYNTMGKRLGVVGNVVLALCYASPLLFILEITGNLSTYAFFSLAFALLTFSHNLLVSWQDLPGEMDMMTAAKQLGALVPPISLATTCASIVSFLLSNLSAVSVTLFVAAAVVVGTASVRVILASGRSSTSTIEWLCRRLARVVLMMAFTALLFAS